MVGNWKLNSHKSTVVDEMQVTSVGQNKYAFDFGSGSTETIAVDGTDQPGIFGTTLAVTPEKPDQWRIVRKKDGRVEVIGIWTLSPKDGALHDNYTEFDENGKSLRVDYIYGRHGGGSGFAGDWVSTTQQVDTVYVVEVRPFQGDGLAIVAQGTTKNFKLDGKDYPDPGSKRNVVSTAQRVNERTIKLTSRISEKVVDMREITVSSEGKTLTMTVHPPGRNEPDVLVFDGQ